MKTQSYLKILQKGSISNELELEKALIIERKLRLLAKENPELAESRTQLRAIIKEYEQSNWSADSIISNKKIQESDVAELIAEQERKFLKLINKLRNIAIDLDELKQINQIENAMILDLLNLTREQEEFLYYLADKYHDSL